jgi:hypothetical protein
MRISNSLSLVCAASLCLGSLTAWADPDTEAQAKAREALRKALQDTDAGLYKPVVTSPAASPEAIEKAREALRQKIQESPAPADAAAAKPAKALPALKPLEGPASPLPATKQAALAELLKRYMADQITPREYQTERAKILSEP